MAFFPGRATTVTIAGTAKPIDTFEVTCNGEPIDVTNFTSSGWQENELGIKNLEISASGPYNGASSGASAGDPIGTSIAFVVDFDGAGAGFTALTIPARLTSIRVGTGVRDVAKVYYTAISNGSVTVSI